MHIKNEEEILNIDPTEEDILQFFIKLYPHGVSFIQEIKDTKEENEISYEKAEEILNNQIMSLIKEGRISMIEKKDKESGFHEKYIVLTDSGKNITWMYMKKVLLQKQPREYIRILKQWIDRGDEIANAEYNTLLLTEINQYYKVMYSMIHPSTKVDIVKTSAMIEQFDNKNKEKIENIINFVGRCLTYGLVSYTANEEGETLYQLTEDGLNGLRLIDKGLKGDNNTQNIIATAPNNDDNDTNIITRFKKEKSNIILIIFISLILYLLNYTMLDNAGYGLFYTLQLIIIIPLVKYIIMIIKQKAQK